MCYLLGVCTLHCTACWVRVASGCIIRHDLNIARSQLHALSPPTAAWQALDIRYAGRKLPQDHSNFSIKGPWIDGRQQNLSLHYCYSHWSHVEWDLPLMIQLLMCIYTLDCCYNGGFQCSTTAIYSGRQCSWLSPPLLPSLPYLCKVALW